MFLSSFDLTDEKKTHYIKRFYVINIIILKTINEYCELIN